MNELIQIDDLTRICGHSYSLEEPIINNGYNCNHPNCEETAFVKHDNEIDLMEETTKYYFKISSGKKKRLKKKISKKLQDLYNNDTDSLIKLLKIKCIGKCYTFSCPVAFHADLQDMKELDNDLYEEYKAEGERNSDYLDTSDWMVYDGDGGQL